MMDVQQSLFEPFDPKAMFVEPDPPGTMAEGRDTLRSKARSGCRCPVCERMVKVYPNRMRWTMACLCVSLARKALAEALTGAPPRFFYVHVPTFLLEVEGLPARARAAMVRSGGCVSPNAWGLLRREPGANVDGNPLKGRWALTKRGFDFARGTLLVPNIALTYNRRVLGFIGKDIGIKQALKQRVEYDQIMGGF